MKSSSDDIVAIAMYTFGVDKTLHPKKCMSGTGRYICELLSRKSICEATMTGCPVRGPVPESTEMLPGCRTSPRA